jgi:hypothetical protein
MPPAIALKESPVDHARVKGNILAGISNMIYLI